MLKVEELLDGVLQIAGRPELLTVFVQDFWFDSGEGGHHHPDQHDALMWEMDPTSVSLIIEVDDWADDPEGWAAEDAPDGA
jgi:sporulation-control protein spo0M